MGRHDRPPETSTEAAAPAAKAARARFITAGLLHACARRRGFDRTHVHATARLPTHPHAHAHTPAGTHTHSCARMHLQVDSTMLLFCQSSERHPFFNTVKFKTYRLANNDEPTHHLHGCRNDQDARPAGAPLPGYWTQKSAQELRVSENSNCDLSAYTLCFAEDLWV